MLGCVSLAQLQFNIANCLLSGSVYAQCLNLVAFLTFFLKLLTWQCHLIMGQMPNGIPDVLDLLFFLFYSMKEIVLCETLIKSSAFTSFPFNLLANF